MLWAYRDGSRNLDSMRLANDVIDVPLVDRHAVKQMHRYRIDPAHEFTKDVRGNLHRTRQQGAPRGKPPMLGQALNEPGR